MPGIPARPGRATLDQPGGRPELGASRAAVTPR